MNEMILIYAKFGADLNLYFRSYTRRKIDKTVASFWPTV